MSRSLIIKIAFLSTCSSVLLLLCVSYLAGLFEWFSPAQIIVGLFLVAGFIFGLVYGSIAILTLSKSEFNEHSILDNSLTGIFIARSSLNLGDLLYVNPAFADLFKQPIENLLADEFLPEKFWVDSGQRNGLIENIRREKMIASVELKLRNQHGKEWWGRLSCRHLDTADGLKLQGTLIDITEKKKFEEVLTNYNETLEREIGERTKERDEIQKMSILGLSKITEYRDPETGNHVIRMAHYSKILTRAMRDNPKYRQYITDTYIDEIFISAPLHDIGKVGIEDRILKKPGKLTPEEFDMMKYHTIYGGDTLRDVEKQLSFRSFLTLGKEIAYNHHQKWNGQGYPNYPPEGGHPTLNIPDHKPLKGSEIPLSARIVALADVYDALSSKRCYKNAMTHEQAKDIIIKESGEHFDPDIVDAFKRSEGEFTAILDKFKD